ncbi:fmt [Symbiodinium natans]|uniref:Fmt protein n=1 Tax=Symbiodinium natans TaxID=878477 RepID=A0A812SVG0_9DINO|nr:fmt [Symbiodinium natans]
MAAASDPGAPSEGSGPPVPRALAVVGFLGISDYGLGQLEVLASRYEVAFATAKKNAVAHATDLHQKLEDFCKSHGIPYLGSVDANSQSMVDRASRTDLVVIGGYDGILKKAFLSAPKHGVINTHLGLLPQNRGCCPTLWAQLHGRQQGYTTYLVGEAIDHGPIVDMFEVPGLGGLNNRQIYDALAQAAVQRFPAALERFAAGVALVPCRGLDVYHTKGMPNDGWLSFYWSNDFLILFSKALDFAPYLPGRTRLEEDGEAISLAVDSARPLDEDPSAEEAAVGEVLEADEARVLVRSRFGSLCCRQLTGPKVTKGALLRSGRPYEQSATSGPCRHPIPLDFDGQELPFERYLSVTGVQ